MIPGQNTYYNAGDAAKTVKINYAKENMVKEIPRIL